jgi:glycosyltransferase involved in cell wall biosynthesis
MRIAFVSPTAAGLFAETLDYTGGAEIQQFLLAQSFARHGLEPVFVVADRAGLRPGPIRHFATAYPLSARTPLERAAGTRALWSALARADADVYIQQGAGAITLETALFTRTAGRRFVYVMASDDEWAGRFVHTHPLRRMIFRQGMRWASAVVTQTERQREEILRRWHQPARMIHGGVRIPPPPDGPARERAALWVGTFRWYKHPERVLELAASLPDVPFWMAGGSWIGGDVRETRAVEAFRARAAAVPNVRLLGLVPNDGIVDLLRHAALLVNTSDFEGFPQTFLEAWATGTPVVTCGVDPDEVLCRHGLGFHASDPGDLPGAVRRLLDDEPLRRQMGRQGYDYVRDRHDVDRIAGEYETLFRDLLDRRDRPPVRAGHLTG